MLGTWTQVLRAGAALEVSWQMRSINTRLQHNSLPFIQFLYKTRIGYGVWNIYPPKQLWFVRATRSDAMTLSCWSWLSNNRSHHSAKLLFCCLNSLAQPICHRSSVDFLTFITILRDSAVDYGYRGQIQILGIRLFSSMDWKLSMRCLQTLGKPRMYRRSVVAQNSILCGSSF